jgi:asparagine synthetase B (glutamine-hydrolysing)
VYVASELKALEGQCDRYEPFLPGHYYWSKDPGMKRYTITVIGWLRHVRKHFVLWSGREGDPSGLMSP